MRIFFFATEADIRPVLRRAEAEIPLKFIETGITTSFVRQIYLRSDDIPNVGISRNKTGQGSTGYLVSLQKSKNAVEKFRDSKGVRRWHLCNGENPDTVDFTAGGLWNGNILLDGGVKALHQTPVAERLMRLLLSSIRREEFTSYDDWWVGPEAFGMWSRGGRLTHSADAPPEFDFKFPDELRQSFAQGNKDA